MSTEAPPRGVGRPRKSDTVSVEIIKGDAEVTNAQVVQYMKLGYEMKDEGIMYRLTAPRATADKLAAGWQKIGLDRAKPASSQNLASEGLLPERRQELQLTADQIIDEE